MVSNLDRASHLRLLHVPVRCTHTAHYHSAVALSQPPSGCGRRDQSDRCRGPVSHCLLGFFLMLYFPSIKAVGLVVASRVLVVSTLHCMCHSAPPHDLADDLDISLVADLQDPSERTTTTGTSDRRRMSIQLWVAYKIRCMRLAVVRRFDLEVVHRLHLGLGLRAPSNIRSPTASAARNAPQSDEYLPGMWCGYRRRRQSPWRQAPRRLSQLWQ